MNEPFGDAYPDEDEKLYRIEKQRERCQRVLTLARELLLNDNVYRTLDQYIIRAEEWIRAEDAYVLPEDMQ